MTQYEDSLVAMKRLLDAAGDTHWSQWIASDIERWRSSRDTSHHLSAYGGMGSFNDVSIGPGSHFVTSCNEAWASTLFQWLKSVCHFLAKHPAESFTAGTLQSNARSMHGYWNDTGSLQGWRCLKCGRAEVSPSAIEFLMARIIIPQMLFEYCEKRELESLVDRLLAVDIPGIDEMRTALSEAATAGEMLLKERDTWNWTCPYCQSDDTAAYRWDLLTEDGYRFEPSSDNLPLRQ